MLVIKELLDHGFEFIGYSDLHYRADDELKNVIDSLTAGQFSEGDGGLFKPIVDSLLRDDHYMLLTDYASYIECSERAGRAYRDPENWTRMSILNTARCGFFSSDRSMRQYSDEIWNVDALKPAYSLG